MSRPPDSARALLWLLSADGALGPAAIAAALAVAAAGLVLEATLFRGLVELGRDLGLVEQRIAALGALMALGAGLLLLEGGSSMGVLRLGWRLELRLRLRLFARLRGLDPQQHRETGDIAQRIHAIHSLRSLPIFLANALRLACEVLLMTAGMIWIYPAGAGQVLALAALAVAAPLLLGRRVKATDLQFQTSKGRLGKFYLDAMTGAVPLRGHGAAEALRHEHQRELVQWLAAGWSRQRALLLLEAIQGLGGATLTAWLLLAYLTPEREPAGMLLLVYWALHLPSVAQDLSGYLGALPSMFNLAQRFHEALGGDAPAEPPVAPAAASSAPLALRLAGVTVRLDGQVLLDGLDLDIAAGEHIAVVGPSGAGKSTLVGLLLGLVRADEGQVLVDGAPLDAARLARVRLQTAWVEPGVQLWDRTLADNLSYGAAEDRPERLGAAVAEADLQALLEQLPEGMQTRLGGDGAQLSGGEAQRVRLARALLRPDARLVILDEPFRGLDRAHRGELLARARRLWRGATLICVTHDLRETAGFARVLVVERGRIVEDAAPGLLAARPSSRHADLLAAEQALAVALAGPAWRQLQLHRGRIAAAPPEAPDAHA